MKLLYLDCFAGISGDMFLGPSPESAAMATHAAFRRMPTDELHPTGERGMVSLS